MIIDKEKIYFCPKCKKIIEIPNILQGNTNIIAEKGINIMCDKCGKGKIILDIENKK